MTIFVIWQLRVTAFTILTMFWEKMVGAKFYAFCKTMPNDLIFSIQFPIQKKLSRLDLTQ
jgi:hypothetical protein